MLLFYDVDLFCEGPKPEPLTDEQYRQRCETYDTLVADYKARVAKAFGRRQVRTLEKAVVEFKDRNAMLDLPFEDWSAFLDDMLRICCEAIIEAKIKYTPKKYKNGWTAEELDNLIGICGIDDQGRYNIFKDAGLPCEKPACMERHSSITAGAMREVLVSTVPVTA